MFADAGSWTWCSIRSEPSSSPGRGRSVYSSEVTTQGSSGTAMCKNAFVGVLVAVFAPTVTGQDAVEIKFARPKVGERLKVTVEERTDRKVTGKPIGPKDPNGTTIQSFVYVDEPLEV